MSEPAAIDTGALVAPSNPVFKLAEAGSLPVDAGWVWGTELYTVVWGSLSYPALADGGSFQRVRLFVSLLNV